MIKKDKYLKNVVPLKPIRFFQISKSCKLVLLKKLSIYQGFQKFYFLRPPMKKLKKLWPLSTIFLLKKC